MVWPRGARFLLSCVSWTVIFSMTSTPFKTRSVLRVLLSADSWGWRADCICGDNVYADMTIINPLGKPAPYLEADLCRTLTLTKSKLRGRMRGPLPEVSQHPAQASRPPCSVSPRRPDMRCPGRVRGLQRLLPHH